MVSMCGIVAGDYYGEIVRFKLGNFVTRGPKFHTNNTNFL